MIQPCRRFPICLSHLYQLTHPYRQCLPHSLRRSLRLSSRHHLWRSAAIVGKDIKPGTYRTRKASAGCYWARLSGFGGSLSEVIANQNTDAPEVVTINAGDKGFTSQGCDTWTADLSRITQSKTSFDEGTYIVNTDIEPGTYKSSGGSGCYYARLSGFGGVLDNIITNNNADSSAVVTVDGGDAGFTSVRCGTWTKVS